MSRDAYRRDFLAAVEETYGRRPFTIPDLEEKGLPVPAGVLRNRGIFLRAWRGRLPAWRLAQGREGRS